MKCIPESNKIIVLGGFNNDGNCSDVWEYNIRLNSWRLLVSPFCEESKFVALSGHTMVPFNDGFLIFGGCRGGSLYTNQLLYYDVRSNNLQEIKSSGEVPSPRHKHQSLIIGNKMFVIGGGKVNSDFIDVYTLCLSSFTWECIATFGDIPKATMAHCCMFDQVSKNVFLFGGQTMNAERQNDLLAFDIVSFEWKRVKSVENSIPSPRAFHVGTIHCDSLYVFGGNGGIKRCKDVWQFRIRVQPERLVNLAALALLKLRNSQLDNGKLPSEILHELLILKAEHKKTRSISWKKISRRALSC
jgi:hypothetical protein